MHDDARDTMLARIHELESVVEDLLLTFELNMDDMEPETTEVIKRARRSLGK